MTGSRIDRGVAAPAFLRADIEQTIPARFRHVAANFPDRVALTGAGRQWTYSDLARATNRIARAIRARTPAEIGCVAFLVPQSPEMVLATLGVVKSGKAYLGIHPQMPAAAQRNILQDAMPQLLLTIADLLPRAEPDRPAGRAVGASQALSGVAADTEETDRAAEIDGTGSPRDCRSCCQCRPDLGFQSSLNSIILILNR